MSWISFPRDFLIIDDRDKFLSSFSTFIHEFLPNTGILSLKSFKLLFYSLNIYQMSVFFVQVLMWDHTYFYTKCFIKSLIFKTSNHDVWSSKHDHKVDHVVTNSSLFLVVSFVVYHYFLWGTDCELLVNRVLRLPYNKFVKVLRYHYFRRFVDDWVVKSFILWSKMT